MKTNNKLAEWEVKVDGKHNHNDSVMVANINGTSSAPYKIDKLYSRYIAAGGNAVAECQAKGCCETATATAHVRLLDGRRQRGEDGKRWRLTRLCATHNHHTNTGEIPLRKNAALLKVTEVRNTPPKARAANEARVVVVNVNRTASKDATEEGTRTPTKKDAGSPGSGTVHVKEYVKANGTVVPAHERSAPSPSKASPSPGTVYVKEYVKANGTVVPAHERSAPSPPKSGSSPATVTVSGYVKSDGTSVASYTRSAPSPSKSSSPSSSGSSSPYAGSSGSSGSSSTPGTVSVSGYTRSNGTYVSGYTRSK